MRKSKCSLSTRVNHFLCSARAVWGRGMFAALFVSDEVKNLQLQLMQTAQCHYVGSFSSTLLRLHHRNSSVSHKHLVLLHQVSVQQHCYKSSFVCDGSLGGCRPETVISVMGDTGGLWAPTSLWLSRPLCSSQHNTSSLIHCPRYWVHRLFYNNKK